MLDAETVRAQPARGELRVERKGMRRVAVLLAADDENHVIPLLDKPSQGRPPSHQTDDPPEDLAASLKAALDSRCRTGLLGGRHRNWPSDRIVRAIRQRHDFALMLSFVLHFTLS